jgi:hypothetical protein
MFHRLRLRAGMDGLERTKGFLNLCPFSQPLKFNCPRYFFPAFAELAVEIILE